MNSTDENPTITPFLRAFTLIETLVLVGAVLGCFFFQELFAHSGPGRSLPLIHASWAQYILGAMVPVGFMYPFRTLVANPSGVEGHLYLHIHCACCFAVYQRSV